MRWEVVVSYEATNDLREQVRSRYGRPYGLLDHGVRPASTGCSGSSASESFCGTASEALEAGDWYAAARLRRGRDGRTGEGAVLASLGCGDPLAVADLGEGERVLDLGSGGGSSTGSPRQGSRTHRSPSPMRLLPACIALLSAP